ncbi:MAG: Rrf2 family transcriptional regulator [Nitrosomonadales bacterium]|jgi:Rrf2 family iron-sulfur cluster assembly transcriptional regulator|nr:Rrf2 family transcriptional regulator [Nitrosomonadales bacterium]MBT6014642.1 Rrf2 family transcriptional regulator [Nitrosomonadales bacterium]
MKLTTKGRFAVTAMLDLALNEKDKPIKLSEISKRQSISLSYLEQLFGKLRKQGLVKSVRGPGGGYFIAKEHNTISIKNIISSVDEQIDATQCGGTENCNEGHQCITHNLWTTLNAKILNYLNTTTLDELVKTQKNKVEKKPIALPGKKNKVDSNRVGVFLIY